MKSIYLSDVPAKNQSSCPAPSRVSRSDSLIWIIDHRLDITLTKQ